MKTLKDYVQFISESMGVELTDQELYQITKYLIHSEQYEAMLHELEDKIIQVSQSDVVDIADLKAYSKRGYRD